MKPTILLLLSTLILTCTTYNNVSKDIQNDQILQKDTEFTQDITTSEIMVTDIKNNEQSSASDAVEFNGYVIFVDISYPQGSVKNGERPVVALYSAASYSDFSKKPESMPMGALLGDEKSLHLSGFVLDLGQVNVKELENGKYSVVAGVTGMSGMPMPIEGKAYIGKIISTDQKQSNIIIKADDLEWGIY